MIFDPIGWLRRLFFASSVPELPPVSGVLAELLDPGRDADARADAACLLAQYDEPEAEQALVRLGSDPEESPAVLESCGQSLALVWARRGRVDWAALRALDPRAFEAAADALRGLRREWAVELDRLRARART